MLFKFVKSVSEKFNVIVNRLINSAVHILTGEHNTASHMNDKSTTICGNKYCKMEDSLHFKELEILIRLNKIRRSQTLMGLQPCYCNENIPKENVSSKMCKGCAFKDTCDMRRDVPICYNFEGSEIPELERFCSTCPLEDTCKNVVK